MQQEIPFRKTAEILSYLWTWQYFYCRTGLLYCKTIDNGGDGYTAARHLAQLGYKADVLYTKKPEKELFQGLIKSCEADYVGIFDYSQDENFSKNFEAKIKEYDMIVDAMFGFSFKGPLKEPFDHICGVLKSGKPLIFSIDVPSGWNIEEGNVITLLGG